MESPRCEWFLPKTFRLRVGKFPHFPLQHSIPLKSRVSVIKVKGKRVRCVVIHTDPAKDTHFCVSYGVRKQQRTSQWVGELGFLSCTTGDAEEAGSWKRDLVLER